MNSAAHSPVHDVLAPRVDGVAAVAKDAEAAIFYEITQSSQSVDFDEINREVLAESGIPHATVKPVKRVNPIGKHIEFEPVRRPIPVQVRPSFRSTPIKEPVMESFENSTEVQPALGLESEEGDSDGQANEAFEAMEAMDFGTEFDFDSNQEGDDLGLDMGVD
jgi:hypothetical protein